MAKKLYVGKLSYNTTESELRTMFEEFGSVESVQVIMDAAQLGVLVKVGRRLPECYDELEKE